MFFENIVVQDQMTSTDWFTLFSSLLITKWITVFKISRGAIKRDFWTCIRRYTSPNENFEYGYPHSNVLLQFGLKLERYKDDKGARHPTKCGVINDVKLYLTVAKFWRYPIRSRVTNSSALKMLVTGMLNVKKTRIGEECSRSNIQHDKDWCYVA